ncbi:MAG: rRNA maturation RNase YbeY [Synergistes sp.]|nr:rRNA maturation RNase YbeY [Synergistes sp.]
MNTVIRCGTVSGKSTEDVFPEEKLKRLAEVFSAYLTAERLLPEAVSDCEVSLVFAEKDEIAGLNFEYRDTEGPTDVLSFPMWEDEEGRFSPPEDWESLMLGDVIVCPEVAGANAEENGSSAEKEIALLICHGFLHLLGFDHAEDEERDVMWKAQTLLLENFMKKEEPGDD